MTEKYISAYTRKQTLVVASQPIGNGSNKDPNKFHVIISGPNQWKTHIKKLKCEYHFTSPSLHIEPKKHHQFLT